MIVCASCLIHMTAAIAIRLSTARIAAQDSRLHEIFLMTGREPRCQYSPCARIARRNTRIRSAVAFTRSQTPVGIAAPTLSYGTAKEEYLMVIRSHAPLQH